MALIQVNYLSKALLRTVPLTVILPADRFDFDTRSYTVRSKKFKTLYLLHGLLGNYTDWISGTRIQRWAEEKELAVVMPSGDNAFYVNSRIDGNNYSEFVGRELVEITRRMFPLSKKREDTFIAGLSMGGYGAIINGLHYSETFSCAAGLSSAVHLFDETAHHLGLEYSVFGDMEAAARTYANPPVALREVQDQKRPMPRLYLACGRADDLYDANVEFRDLAIASGADVTWDEDGSGHDWDFWDRQIRKVLDWLPLK